MKQLFDDNKDNTVFFVGGAYNEAQFFDWFTLRFAFCTSNETLTKRLQQREPDRWANGTPELTEKLEWNSKFREYSQLLNAVIIDSEQPIEKVVDDTLAYIPKGERLND